MAKKKKGSGAKSQPQQQPQQQQQKQNSSAQKKEEPKEEKIEQQQVAAAAAATGGGQETAALSTPNKKKIERFVNVESEDESSSSAVTAEENHGVKVSGTPNFKQIREIAARTIESERLARKQKRSGNLSEDTETEDETNSFVRRGNESTDESNDDDVKRGDRKKAGLSPSVLKGKKGAAADNEKESSSHHNKKEKSNGEQNSGQKSESEGDIPGPESSTASTSPLTRRLARRSGKEEQRVRISMRARDMEEWEQRVSKVKAACVLQGIDQIEVVSCIEDDKGIQGTLEATIPPGVIPSARSRAAAFASLRAERKASMGQTSATASDDAKNSASEGETSSSSATTTNKTAAAAAASSRTSTASTAQQQQHQQQQQQNARLSSPVNVSPVMTSSIARRIGPRSAVAAVSSASPRPRRMRDDEVPPTSWKMTLVAASIVSIVAFALYVWIVTAIPGETHDYWFPPPRGYRRP